MGEFGLAEDKWGRSPYMERDTEGVHFHIALWALAFSGLSGTAMFWWWEPLDQRMSTIISGPWRTSWRESRFWGLRRPVRQSPTESPRSGLEGPRPRRSYGSTIRKPRGGTKSSRNRRPARSPPPAWKSRSSRPAPTALCGGTPLAQRCRAGRTRGQAGSRQPDDRHPCHSLATSPARSCPARAVETPAVENPRMARYK